jgi:hypothetical protein
MSIDKQTFVIAGASPAGAKAAQTLRDYEQSPGCIESKLGARSAAR